VANNPLNTTDSLGLYCAVSGRGRGDIQACGDTGFGSYETTVWGSPTAYCCSFQGPPEGVPDSLVITVIYPFASDLSLVQESLSNDYVSAWLALKNATANAKTIIENSLTCDSFFGGNGVQTINSTTYLMGATLSEAYGKGVPMLTQQQGVLPPTVVVNPDVNGAFLSPPQQFYGASGESEVQSFFVLHEAGHALSDTTGFLSNDYSKNPDGTPNVPGQANQLVNNLRLSYNCFK
jgi:hypothetical protein